MDDTDGPAPPAYSKPCDRRWMIKNAKFRSEFVGSRHDFSQEHTEYSQNPLDQSLFGLGFVPPEIEQLRLVDMQCSPALVDIPNFFDEYQNCIRMMSPISEETLLFLLLRRFSDLTGAEVYAEIRLLEDVQIYDSTISVPQEVTPSDTHSHCGSKDDPTQDISPEKEKKVDQLEQPSATPYLWAGHTSIMNFPSVVSTNNCHSLSVHSQNSLECFECPEPSQRYLLRGEARRRYSL